MVDIRRPNRHRSSSTSFWTCRNIFLLAVLAQLLSLIATLLRSPAGTTKVTTSPVDRQPSTEDDRSNRQTKATHNDNKAKGVQDVLKGFGEKGDGGKQSLKLLPKLSPNHQRSSPTTSFVRRERDGKDNFLVENEREKEENSEEEQPVGDREEGQEDENSNLEKLEEDSPQQPRGEEDHRQEGDNGEEDPDERRNDLQDETPQNAAVGEQSTEHAEPHGNTEMRTKITVDESQGTENVLIAVDASAGGSGPTSVGYLADYQYERNHPEFRNHSSYPLDTLELESSVKLQLRDENLMLKSCHYIQDQRLMFRSTCRDNTKNPPLIAYNAAPFSRSWCGIILEPNKAVRMKEHCTEPVRLLPMDNIPLDGVDMPPITVASYKLDTEAAEFLGEFVPCDIPCQSQEGLNGNKLYIGGTDWTIHYSWDDPLNNVEARVERTAYRKDEYYATTSFKSSVPLSFFSFDKYDLRNTQAVNFDQAQDMASYLISKNCQASGSRRGKWFASMKKYFRVASLGSCDHDTNLPAGVTLRTPEGRVSVMKNYRFNMAFDATTEKDYISPLVWESLLSGSVPIILGAQNMKDHLPPKSFIAASDFSLWDLMSQYVVTVAANKTLWESYHDWRHDSEALDEFETRYNFTRSDPICRMCRWAYARKYGLGWDHQQQRIKKNHLSRKLCSDPNTGLATSPFHESWSQSMPTPSSSHSTAVGSLDTTCSDVTNMENTIDVGDDVTVHRTIVQHDGVSDIFLHKTEIISGDLFLKLQFNVRNSDGAYFPNTHRLVSTQRGALVSSISIQDEFSKVTVLASWETKISSPVEGVVTIQVRVDGESSPPPDLERRIRIITEDMNVLHDKMTEYFPSPFGKMMTMDFVDPLELFFVES